MKKQLVCDSIKNSVFVDTNKKMKQKQNGQSLI